jgi:hypothetical protein
MSDCQLEVLKRVWVEWQDSFLRIAISDTFHCLDEFTQTTFRDVIESHVRSIDARAANLFGRLSSKRAAGELCHGGVYNHACALSHAHLRVLDVSDKRTVQSQRPLQHDSL